MSHSRLVNDVCVGQNEEAGGNFLCKKRQIIPENEFRDVGESSDHIIDHRIENYEHCVSVISHSLSLDVFLNKEMEKSKLAPNDASQKSSLSLKLFDREIAISNINDSTYSDSFTMEDCIDDADIMPSISMVRNNDDVCISSHARESTDGIFLEDWWRILLITVESALPDQPSNFRKLLARRDLKYRTQVNKCLKVMRAVYKATLVFMIWHGDILKTSLSAFTTCGIKKLEMAIDGRRKLGSLVDEDTGNKHLRIFPQDVKGVLSLVFFYFCLGLEMDDFCLLILKLRQSDRWLLWEYCLVVKGIVDGAPVEDAVPNISSTIPFIRDLCIIDVVLRSSITMIHESGNMEGHKLISELEKMKSGIVSIKNRCEYIQSCDLKKFMHINSRG